MQLKSFNLHENWHEYWAEHGEFRYEIKMGGHQAYFRDFEL